MTETKFIKGKSFIDTNILLYVFSINEETKRSIALDLLQTVKDRSAGAVSVQVMNELSNQLFLNHKLEAKKIREILLTVAEFEIEETNMETILLAIEIKDFHKFSYWDSLIIASAHKCNCRYLITEDLSHGQIVKGIQIINPFK